jgi:rhodanese-related sulfurtransferase
MRTLFAIGLFALCSAAFGQSSFGEMVKDAKTRIREVDSAAIERMQKAGEAYLLVDVREDSEWDAGHAKGAVHVGRGVLERDIEKKVADKRAKIVLYCGGGARSALAADVLQKMGYTDVYSLAGGFGAYSKAGLPVEK